MVGHTRTAGSLPDNYSWPNDEQVLLDFKANVNAVDFNGDTPLSKAARAGMVDVFEALLAAGAELEIRDVENNIAGDVFNKKASNRFPVRSKLVEVLIDKTLPTGTLR